MVFVKNIVISISSLSFIVFVWEYTAIRRSSEISPSVGLNYVATQSQYFWEKCGIFAAWVSSFLTVFDFSDMIKAGKQIGRPVVKTVMSWGYFFNGYLSQMNLYEHPYLVVFGSVSLLALLYFALQYFILSRLFSRSLEISPVEKIEEHEPVSVSRSKRTLR